MNLNRRDFIQLLSLLPPAGVLSGANPSTPGNKATYHLNRYGIVGLQPYQQKEEDILQGIEPGETLDLLQNRKIRMTPLRWKFFVKIRNVDDVHRSDNKHISRLLEQGARLGCRVIEVDLDARVWNMVRVEVWMV